MWCSMFDKEFWKTLASGMKGNSDALLALAAFATGLVLISIGVNVVMSLGFPTVIFLAYCFLMASRKKQDVLLERTKTDRSIANGQVKLKQTGKGK